MPVRVRHSVLRLAAMALTSVTAVAATPPASEVPPDSEFALTAWPNDEGLPGDVLAIAEDAAGYLWLGGPAGLVRFDGARFHPWTPATGSEPWPSNPVHALTTASDGGLWVGFGGGGGVGYVRGGILTRHLPSAGAPPGVNALLEDRHGVIWAATGHGLFTYRNRRWSKLAASDGYKGEQSFSVYEDREGRLWIGTAHGLYTRDEKGLRLVDPTATRVDGIVEDASGGLWLTDPTALVARVGGAAPPVGGGIRLPLPGWRVMRDHRGGLIVASQSGGVFRVPYPESPTPEIRPVAYEHRMRGSPRALHEDREGNIWVGMRGGLLRLSENSFHSGGPLDGLNHEGVRTAAVGADFSIWIATTHAINRLSDARRQSFPIAQTRALHLSRDGAMWVAADDGIGRHVAGRLIVEPVPDVHASRVMALATTPETLWLCTAFRGVQSWTASTLTSHRQPNEPARQCLTIIADREDRVWAGFTSGGVAVHEGQTVRAVTERDGLAPGAVLRILEASDGALWFATDSGVSRFANGRMTTITGKHAPVTAVVPVLVEDEGGYMWVGIRSGAAVMRLHPREMDKVAADDTHQVAYTIYDDTDGLQPGTQLWPRGVGSVRDAHGRLWVVDGLGMTVIDPGRLRALPPPSPPMLETLTVDGERVLPVSDSTLRNGATVAVEYAALSLSAASKLRFRHMLEGSDAGWVYDGQNRQARYSQLPAGDYRLRVGATHDGEWVDASVWAFSVAPPFYLSGWFLGVLGVGMAAAVGAGTWLRFRAVKMRYALVLGERTRLSREMHDTLLQSLAALGPELEVLATRATSGDDEVANELRRVRRQVARSVREARESILELRRHPMHTPRLADSLAELADTTASRHGVRPHVVVEGRRPDGASSDVDMQLFRIAQEAVTNAIRHGRPSRIDIAVSYEGERVSLAIVDDGAGFTPGELGTWRTDGEHFGLVTMRERAEKVGGSLTVESAPGRGTTVRTVTGVTSAWQ